MWSKTSFYSSIKSGLEQIRDRKHTTNILLLLTTLPWQTWLINHSPDYYQPWNNLQDTSQYRVPGSCYQSLDLTLKLESTYKSWSQKSTKYGDSMYKCSSMLYKFKVFFFFKIYVFETERSRGRESLTQTLGWARSPTWSHNPVIMTWAKTKVHSIDCTTHVPPNLRRCYYYYYHYISDCYREFVQIVFRNIWGVDGDLCLTNIIHSCILIAYTKCFWHF